MILKKGTQVKIIAGKDKGKTGKVVSILNESDKLIVEGVNLVKKHQKANPQAGVAGGVIEKEAPIHVSNVAIVNPATGKADRVGFRFEDEKKVRFFKSNGELV